MDGFTKVLRSALRSAGVPAKHIFADGDLELPGYFRPNKKWDIVVVKDQSLIAAIELKSQVGSFGNNANNRAEEAVGNSTDFWVAYREGAYRTSAQPWLGYLVLVEDAPASRRPIRTREPHFSVFREFKNASYQQRYVVLCDKLLRERQYSAACLLTANERESASAHNYVEHAEHLGAERFISSLKAHVRGALGQL